MKGVSFSRERTATLLTQIEEVAIAAGDIEAKKCTTSSSRSRWVLKPNSMCSAGNGGATVLEEEKIHPDPPVGDSGNFC